MRMLRMTLSRRTFFLLMPLLLIAAANAQPVPPDSCLPEGCQTFTQGGWGAGCQGNNPGCIRDANFDGCFGEELIIGGIYTLTFTGSAAVEAFLPAGGTPGSLTSSQTDPAGDTDAGVFAGQVLAFALNLGFATCNVSGFCADFGTLEVFSGPFAGYTVAQLFALANDVLGGDLSGLPAGASVSDLNDAVTAVNENFNEGANDGFLILPECEGEQLPDEWDLGDLEACYPTEVRNPAHRITGIAWLGATVDAEDTPDTLNQDEGDDGVTLFNAPWTPCEIESVQVDVTAGPNYPAFTDSGGTLFLNAWKDGNLDCDFCDVLCDTAGGGGASEWIVQNAVVTPGSHTFVFLDPGVTDLGVYHGHLRFRLSEVSLTQCDAQGAVDVGEVEDYIVVDLQLAVELLGGLTALAGDGSVSLAWATASERNNSHFEILRDEARIASLPGAGTSASRHDYRYTDSNLENGRLYRYRLVAVDVNGVREDVAAVNAVPQTESATLPAEFALQQNYPNPFNPSTSITYQLKEAVPVRLTVFDLTGREVATLVSTHQPAGTYRVTFDASHLATGMYLYRLEAGSFTAVRKLMLMK